jgi:hypothetical protein
VLQPGVEWLGQFGTVTHGNSFSGSGLNGVQKPLRVQKLPRRPEELRIVGVAIRSDSNKRACFALCGSGHMPAISEGIGKNRMLGCCG